MSAELDEPTDGDSCQGRMLTELSQLGYTCLSPAALLSERDSVREVLLVERLVAALQRLNPGLSEANLHRALRELGGTAPSPLRQANRRVQALVTNGLQVEPKGGTRRPRTIRYFDFDHIDANDFVVTWQLPVRGVHRQVVLDLVVFVNGIPLVVMACAPLPFQGADTLWSRGALAELWRQQEGDADAHERGVPRLFESVHLILALTQQSAVYGSVLTPPYDYVGCDSPYAMLAPKNLLDRLHNRVSLPAARATVPVYLEERYLESIQTEAERTRRICRDLCHHFLRAVFPTGGKAQILAKSAEAARQYRRTLQLLHPQVAPHILVGCNPLESELHVVYVDAPLQAPDLSRVRLSVNRPAKDKLFGLIVDYARTCADVIPALAKPAAELPRLRLYQQAAVHLLSPARNLYSLDQCLAQLASATRRIQFAEAVHTYAELLEVLFDSPQAQGFVHELRWLGQVLFAAAARYQDDRLKYPLRGAQVRALVEQVLLQETKERVAKAGYRRDKTAAPTARIVHEVLTAAAALAAAETHPTYGPSGESAVYDLAKQLDSRLTELVGTDTAELARALKQLTEQHLLTAGSPPDRAAFLASHIVDRLLSSSP